MRGLSLFMSMAIAALSAGAQDMKQTTSNIACPKVKANITTTVSDCRTVYFKPEITAGQGPFTFFWASDEGFTSTSEDPTFRFQRPGKHPFTVRIIPADPCDTFTYKSVLNIEFEPLAALVSTPETNCSEIHFKTQVFGDDAPLAYTWSTNNFIFSHQKDPVFDFGGPGTFSYHLQITKGACDTFEFDGQIHVPPPSPVEAGSDFQVCYTASKLKLSGYPEGGIWAGDGVTAEWFDPSSVNPGNHTLYYRMVTGHCTTADSLVVTVVQPQADFTPSTTDGKWPLEVSFLPTGTRYSGVVYQWDFDDPASGNANFSKEQSPTHRFNKPGLYYVTLSVGYPDIACYQVVKSIKPIAVSSPDQLIEYQFENHIALWPNPVCEQVHMTMDEMPFPIYTLRIENVQGQVVKTLSNLSGARQDIDLSALKPGWYIMRVIFPGGTSYQRKFTVD